MIEKLKSGEPVAHNWRTINEVVAQLNANLVPDQQRNAAIAGLRQRPRDVRGGNGPLTHYDPDESYLPGDRVVVYPTDTLVTTGLLDEETDVLRKAPAGIYCCIQAAAPIPIDPEAPEGGSTYNPPKWPTETADNIEAVSTYWWLESLYPMLTSKCVENPEDPGGDLIETEYYENTQPVPPEE